MHIAKLEAVESVPICDIKVGTFYWTNQDGEKCDAEFYVNTCDDSDQAKQVNDYNEQLTDEWTRLINDKATNITYVQVTPDPIF